MSDDGENVDDGDVVQSVVITTEASLLPRLLTVQIPPRNGYRVSTSEHRYLSSVWDAVESGKNLCIQIPNNQEMFELLVSFIMSYHASTLPDKVPCNFVLVSVRTMVTHAEKIVNDVSVAISGRLEGLEDFSVAVLTEYDAELQDYEPDPNIIICSTMDVLGINLMRYLGERFTQYTLIFDEVQDLDVQIGHLSSMRVTAAELGLFMSTLDGWKEQDPSLQPIQAYTFFPNYIPVEFGGALDSATLGTFVDFLLNFHQQCQATPDRATWADFLEQYDGHNIAVALEDLRFSLAWLVDAWQGGGNGVNDRFYQLARFISLLGQKMQSYGLYYDAEKEELQFEFFEPSMYMDRLQNSRSIILTSRSTLHVCHLVLLEGNAQILNLLEDWAWPINRPFTSVFLTHYTSSGSNRALFGRWRTDAEYDVNMLLYGLLIADISRICHSEGILCLFPSFQSLVHCYLTWQRLGTLKEIEPFKNVYWQSDLITTLTRLERYHKGCDAGRGAVFLAVARDHDYFKFSERYGRVVIFMGFPFLTKVSRSLLAKAVYWRVRYTINLDSVLSFFIQRYASESIGRQIMGSNLDNIIVVFADFCYEQRVNRHMLPRWMFLSRNGNADVNENDEFIVNNADRFAQILESLRHH